jgi:hypothetical protein
MTTISAQVTTKEMKIHINFHIRKIHIIITIMIMITMVIIRKFHVMMTIMIMKVIMNTHTQPSLLHPPLISQYIMSRTIIHLNQLINQPAPANHPVPADHPVPPPAPANHPAKQLNINPGPIQPSAVDHPVPPPAPANHPAKRLKINPDLRVIQ